MRVAYLVMGLTLLAVSPVPSEHITQADAAAAVRAFEGDPDLEFETIDLEEKSDGPAWSHRQWYRLADADEDLRRSWLVEAGSGEVFWARYPSRGADEATMEPTGPISKSECLQTAQAFASSKYAQFGQMNFSLYTEEWNGYAWEFCWVEKAAYGAITPNAVRVSVSPLDGRVCGYRSSRFPPPVPSEPQISSEEAVALAKSAAGIAVENYVDGPELATDPDGTYWDLEVDGLDATGVHQNYMVRVNAVSGEVLEAYPGALGGETGKSDAGTHQAVGVLSPRQVLTSMRYTFHWDAAKKQLRAAKGLKQVVILQAGSRTATVNGRQVMLESAPRIENGRMMIPASALGLFR